jgi:CDP-diglyceride synthetase
VAALDAANSLALAFFCGGRGARSGNANSSLCVDPDAVCRLDAAARGFDYQRFNLATRNPSASYECPYYAPTSVSMVELVCTDLPVWHLGGISAFMATFRSMVLIVFTGARLDCGYFRGRRFGKNKLAPQISPGKTREGAFIGLCGVVIWLAVSALYENTYASELKAAWGWPGLILAALLLGLLAIVGDLFESYLKRQADVKDSSRLLPGHGGVFDRIDAVVAVVPVAYLLVTDFWYP